MSSRILKKHFSQHVNTESNNNSFIFPEYESEAAITSFDDLYKLTHNPNGFFSFIHRAWTTRMIQVSQGITFEQDETWPYVPHKIDNWSVQNFLHDSSQALLTFLEVCNPYNNLYNKEYSKMDENTLNNDNDVNEKLAALKGMVIKERQGYCPLRDFEEKLKFVQLEQHFDFLTPHHIDLNDIQLENDGDSYELLNFLSKKCKKVDSKFGEDTYWELEGIKGIKNVSMIADPNALIGYALGIGNTGIDTMEEVTKFIESKHLYVAISVMYNCTLHIPSQKNCNYNLDLDVLWFGTIRGDDPDLSQWKIGRVESEKISKIFDLMEGLMHLHNNKK